MMLFKLILKTLIMIALFFLLFIFLIYFMPGKQRLLLSPFDPNFCLNEINLFENDLNYDYNSCMNSLFFLTKYNDKYRSKTMINFFYHYDKLNDKTKNNFLKSYGIQK